jgi:hypothetical protein
MEQILSRNLARLAPSLTGKIDAHLVCAGGRSLSPFTHMVV